MIRAKKLFAGVLTVVMVFTMSACGAIKFDKYSIPDELSSANVENIDQNEKYTLDWDDILKCAMLRDKATNHVWSTTPYKAYSEGNESNVLNSVLCIEYYDLTDSSMQTERSFTCIDEGTVSSKIEDDSVCVTYYFSVAEITVPVYFSLDELGLRVTVKAKEIVESGKTKLIAISLVPYLCSAQNTQDKSSYLMIPTGSGALIYTDNEVAKSARLYSGEVYGTDAARHLLDVTENEQPITAPVFGAKDFNDNAIFAIIDQGSEAARIDAAAGNTRYGYSNVYASFLVRGYDEIEQLTGGKRTDALALAETWSPKTVYSVCYYPLVGKDANYNGMARFYRNYLENKRLMLKTRQEQKSLQLEIVGGALTKKFFLGIPYEAVIVLTNFNDALGIIKDSELYNEKSNSIVLSGYGESGADIGKIAGGYSFNKNYGNKKKYKAIEEYCKKSNIVLFTDFELLYYNQSGNGFNIFMDTAKTANRQSAAFYPLKINIRFPDEEAGKFRLLKREHLSEAVDKLIKFADKDISGIGLGNLASTVYSDYSNEDTYMKAGMEKQVQELVKRTEKAGYNILLRSANSYAAGLSDVITDVPISNGNYSVFDEEIPFYQMVFGGYSSLYSTPINYESNQRDALLKAVSFGVAPKYLVVKNHNSELSDSKAEYFYSAEYDKIKKDIVDTISETKAFYKAIKDSFVVEHTVLSSGVYKTEFENGTVVYVNFSEENKSADNIVIEKNSFTFTTIN